MSQVSKASVVGLLLFATTAVTVHGAVAQPTVPKIPAAGAVRWGPCPGLPLGLPPRDPRQQCAKVAVPLDYRDLGGRQIQVAISRIPAAPGLRRGVLLMNPGGPGGSGLNMPSLAALLFPAEVQARYDLIGFDPRGLGESTPATCGLTSAEIGAVNGFPYPAPDGDISANIAFAKKIALACDRASDQSLPYITTANTARDMDRIRDALGEPKISYYGLSYGTYLGAVYASLFPQRTDRIVLDSAVDPTRVWREAWKAWGPSTAQRAPDYFTWMANRDLIFHLGRTPEQLRALYFELAGRLDRKPLTLPGGTVVTGNTFRQQLTFAVLYSDLLFPLGASAWKVLKLATDGLPVGAADWKVLKDAIDATANPAATPTTDRRAADAPADSPVVVSLGITCNDTTWPLTAEQHAREVAIDRQQYPISNGMPANIWPCAYWPYKPAEPPVAITDRGPANILIPQNLRDPATPHFGAVNLRRALGDRARMVAVDAGGHGVYRLTGSTCADNATSQFLITGRLPQTDVSCPEGGDPAKALAELTPEQREALDALRKLTFPL